MRTLRLKQLVDETVKSLPTPHTEDVIEDVFLAIENNPHGRKTYDGLVYELGKATVNTWGGFWIAHAVGLSGDERVPATRSSLIDSYSKLVKPAAKRSKKVKEPDALKLMSEHFQANRDSLPATIRDHREPIVTLIMEGYSTEDAFSKVLEKPVLSR
jgi:hypothetical protein